MTMVGRISYDRMALIASSAEDKNKLAKFGHKGFVFPLDEVLGLARLPFKVTAKAMLEIALEASRSNSYEEAEQKLREKTSISINDDTIRAVTNTVGQIVFANEMNKATAVWENRLKIKPILPETKNMGTLYLKAENSRLAVRQNMSQGSSWKEYKLGMAFSTDNFFWWTDHGHIKHRILKKEFTTLLDGTGEFKKLMLALAVRNGYGQYSQTVLIGDGSSWITNMKEDLFPNALQVLDYYHLCEKIINFSKNIFGGNKSRYKPWCQMVCNLLKSSQHDEALRVIKNLGQKLLSRGKYDLIQYINDNINCINYAAYLSQGYFIGGGPMESFSRTVMQRRMKQPGMRWNNDAAQYLVTLSAKYRSNLWEQDVVEPLLQHYGQDRWSPPFEPVWPNKSRAMPNS